MEVPPEDYEAFEFSAADQTVTKVYPNAVKKTKLKKFLQIDGKMKNIIASCLVGMSMSVITVFLCSATITVKINDLNDKFNQFDKLSQQTEMTVSLENKTKQIEDEFRKIAASYDGQISQTLEAKSKQIDEKFRKVAGSFGGRINQTIESKTKEIEDKVMNRVYSVDRRVSQSNSDLRRAITNERNKWPDGEYCITKDEPRNCPTGLTTRYGQTVIGLGNQIVNMIFCCKSDW